MVGVAGGAISVKGGWGAGVVPFEGGVRRWAMLSGFNQAVALFVWEKGRERGKERVVLMGKRRISRCVELLGNAMSGFGCCCKRWVFVFGRNGDGFGQTSELERELAKVSCCDCGRYTWGRYQGWKR